jgi:hypothetical protein
VTTVRIAHAEPRPGRLANGGFHTRGYLVVLADDVGHRAVPSWMQHAGDLADLLERPAGQIVTNAVPAELTTRLLGAAGARVTGVDIDLTEAGAAELSPEVTVARIGLAGPAGTRQVTADLGLGLALAAAAGAPVRLADAVLDRLAVPVPGDDLLTPFLDRVPPALTRPGRERWPLATLRGPRPRYEPRNLDFADGLDRWDLDSWPGPNPDQPDPDRPNSDWQGPADGEWDYSAAVDGPSAVLSSAVPRPAGSAALVQGPRRAVPAGHEAAGPPRALHRAGRPGRPGQPHRHPRRSRRLDDPRGHRADPGRRQHRRVRRLPGRLRPDRAA